MALFVALELETNELLVAIARSASRRLQVENAYSISTEGLDDEAIGKALSESLTNIGVTRASGIGVVDRTDVEMRELSMPPAPPEDVPDMVRFQARSEFGALTDDWTIDFVPYGEPKEDSQTVLAVALSPEIVKRFQTICESANVKLQNIVFRPIAAMDLLRSRLLDGTCRMIVDPTDETTDLTVADGSTLITTRTVKISANYPQEQQNKQLLGECRRTLASAARQTGGRKIEEILICGSREGNEELEGSLSESLDIKSSFVDPFDIAPTQPALKKPPRTQRFAALLGCLLQQDSSDGHQLDFLNPRQRPRTGFDLSRYYLVGGVTIGALLLMALGGWMILRSQTSKIATLEKKRNELIEKNNPSDSKGEPASQILTEVSKLDVWKTKDLNILDELAFISSQMKTPDDAIADLFKTSINNRNELQLELNCRAILESDTEIIKSLRSRPYEIDPGGSTTLDGEGYQQSFDLKLKPNADPTLGVFNQRSVIKRMNEEAQKLKLKLIEQAKENAAVGAVSSADPWSDGGQK